MEFQHISILLSEGLDSLNIRPDGVYVDATLGGAGHSLHIAQRLTEGGRLISIDRDDMALANAEKRLAEVRDRVTLVKSDFRNIDTAVASCGVEQVDGILFDLGVSSPQLDIAERGFSYMHDAKLDMRMDQQQPRLLIVVGVDLLNGVAQRVEEGEVQFLEVHGDLLFVQRICSFRRVFRSLRCAV